MSKKYELVKDNSIDYNNRTLYRIKALKDFGEVIKGNLGGYVESEKNLSQIDNCWVSDNALVYGNAKVYGNATVHGNATVYGNAKVYGNATVHGNATVFNDAEVYDTALVYDNAEVYGNSRVFSDAEVCGSAWVYDNAEVYGNAIVCGNARVYDSAEVTHNAQIKSSSDYLVFKNTWSSGRNFTYTKSNKMWKVGCFYGTGKELVAKAYKDSKESGDKYKLYVDLVNNL